MSRIFCEEVFSFSAFSEENHGASAPLEETWVRNRANSRSRTRLSRDPLVKPPQVDQRIVSRFKHPVLWMRTMAVRFYIGNILEQKSEPEDGDVVSIYELLDRNRKCVGEVWTTQGIALRGRHQTLDFLTISWSLGLHAAGIAEEYLPCWTFNAKELPEFKAFKKYRSLIEQTLQSTPKMTLSGRYGFTKDEGKSQPSIISFFDALFTAVKGEARPKFLWSTVNLLLVEREGVVARRVGTGKVIFNAWLEQWNPRQDCVLA
jgi:hypothetical protein